MRLRVPVIDALPTASVERQGELWRLRDTPGTLHVCLADSGGTYVWIPLTGLDPDDYYTQDEIDALLLDKSDSGHSHDDVYYTESEVDALISGIVQGPLVKVLGSTVSNATGTGLPVGDLSFEVGANETWVVEIRASTSNKTQIGLHRPSGATLSGDILTYPEGASGHIYLNSVSLITPSAMEELHDPGLLSEVQIDVKVTIVNGATIGQFGLTYAAVSGSGEDGNILAGSSLIAHQVG